MESGVVKALCLSIIFKIMAKKKTIEKKVSEAILQQENNEITVGGKTYTYGKPSVATIIMISELASDLPEINIQIKQSELVSEVMATAKDCKVIGKILATIILGAKRIKEEKRSRWHRSELDELAEMILLEMSPSEIAQIISEQLINLEIGSFFGLTASLASQNVLKRTKSEAEE